MKPRLERPRPYPQNPTLYATTIKYQRAAFVLTLLALVACDQPTPDTTAADARAAAAETRAVALESKVRQLAGLAERQRAANERLEEELARLQADGRLVWGKTLCAGQSSK